MVATPARRLFLAWSGVNEVGVVDLTAKMSAFSLAWTQVSLAAVILMGALGAVTGKRIGAICRACASATTIDSEQIGQLQDPFPPATTSRTALTASKSPSFGSSKEMPNPSAPIAGCRNSRTPMNIIPDETSTTSTPERSRSSWIDLFPFEHCHSSEYLDVRLKARDSVTPCKP